MASFPDATDDGIDDIDMDRVVIDPDYRRRVIDGLRRSRLRSQTGLPPAARGGSRASAAAGED